ncbi:serine carboxypeptidase [Panaeolus papilionaceus]|nr:serine carboxypeptidase [Panaeolus papilionaceus]
MIFSFVILFGLLSFPGIFGGQIPVVDGIIGGVSKTSKTKDTFKSASFKSEAAAVGQLRIKENTGICETTSGVYQASGYGDISDSKSIWFWFFAARKNPDTAPVALWFNGGPGSSSMIGLFQEHGPCRINNDTTTVSLNPYSWNNEVNMLYIDQPAGVGFSHGDLDIGTSQDAAADVWTFLQIFFQDSRFAKYQPRNLALWTESYGGHYGPAFAAYFLKQNAAITAKTLTGVTLNLKILGIGNGITDPLVQYPGYMTYAASNPYHALVSSSVISQANTYWSTSGGCKAQINSCYNGGSNVVCAGAQSYCNGNILSPLSGVYDVYYVPAKNPDSYPPDLTKYLSSIRAAAGAEAVWQETNFDIYANFAAFGDWMRNARPDLETVIKAGVRTVLFNGDADYICNYIGWEAMVDALNTQFTTMYKQQTFQPYTVAGQTAGQYKNAGSFSYVRFFGAGHEVPAYKYGSLAYGQAAAQMFTQIMKNQSLSST